MRLKGALLIVTLAITGLAIAQDPFIDTWV
jgi:hypothetical protein